MILQKPLPPNAPPNTPLEPIQATLAEVVALLQKAGFEKVGAQFAEGKRQLIVHVAEDSEVSKAQILNALKPLGDLQDVSFSRISPRVRAETVQRAFMAVILSLVAILLYIALRFSIEGGWSGFKFGLAATIALANDVLFTVGAMAVLGYTLGWEVNALFLTALLTLIGFSVHDTIIAYDRIRENLRHRARGETLAQIVNRSLNQTLARSINTSLTVVIVLLALWALGSVTHDLRTFYVAMTIGVIVGTYSSIFLASQIMVSWQGAAERMRERQLAAAKATAVQAKSTPASSASGGSSDTGDTASAPKKKVRTAHVGKRKRRY
ncbi:MAG: protein translocase subunit SecF [Armatimonadota bacterium]